MVSVSEQERRGTTRVLFRQPAKVTPTLKREWESANIKEREEGEEEGEMGTRQCVGVGSRVGKSQI